LEEIVADQVGSGLVVAGSLTTPVSRESPERITVERADRGLALAPTTPDQKTARWIRLFEAGGINTAGVKEHRALKWSKALLNMIGNASAAILNRHPSMIYKHRPTFDLEVEMLKEAVAVMKNLKIDVVDLPGTPTKRLTRSLRMVPRGILQSILSGMVAEGRGNKMPSFHMDVVAGRKKNEVLYHNVAVAKAGRQAGVPTPVNAALGDTLMGIVRGELDWDEFQGSPQRLIAEVERYRREA
jgi:2-dehydropantoate 2-reductase